MATGLFEATAEPQRILFDCVGVGGRSAEGHSTEEGRWSFGHL